MQHQKLDLSFFCLILPPGGEPLCLCADVNGINMNLFRLCLPPGVEFLCLVRTLGKMLLLFVLSVSSVLGGGTAAKVAVDKLFSI